MFQAIEYVELLNLLYNMVTKIKRNLEQNEQNRTKWIARTFWPAELFKSEPLRRNVVWIFPHRVAKPRVTNREIYHATFFLSGGVP